MAGGGKAAHVGAELGDDRLGGPALDAGGGAQQLSGPSERGQLLLDGVREPVDVFVEEVDVRKDRSDPDGVVRVKVALERFRSLSSRMRRSAFEI